MSVVKSKELKALKSIEKELAECYGTDVAYYPDTFDNFQIVARSLRAVEIIKKYIRVDKPFGSACYIYLNDESEMIPEEEFDLLKEVLL